MMSVVCVCVFERSSIVFYCVPDYHVAMIALNLRDFQKQKLEFICCNGSGLVVDASICCHR